MNLFCEFQNAQNGYWRCLKCKRLRVIVSKRPPVSACENPFGHADTYAQSTPEPTPCGTCGGKPKAALQPNGHGPGSKLLELFDTAGVPHCQACVESAARMDAWGVVGCQERLGEIVEDILPRAREWLTEERPWAHKLLSVTGLEDTALRVAVRQKIQQAIAGC